MHSLDKQQGVASTRRLLGVYVYSGDVGWGRFQNERVPMTYR